MKLPIAVTIALLLVAAGQAYHYAPQLPAQVASHIGANGEPNGWQSNAGFFQFYALMLGIMLLSFYGLPLTFRRMPKAWVNLPNKNYWLADERKAKTTRELQSRMAWCGAGTIAFMVIVFQQVINLNLRQPPVLNESRFFLLLGAYSLFLLIWILSIYRAYRLPPTGDSQP